MKKSICFAVLASCGLAAYAQQPTPGQPADFAATLKNQYNSNKRYVLAAAEKMPEDGYAWRPSGLESELRTFGQVLAHIANENNRTCARIAGTPVPAALDDSKKNYSKAEGTKLIKDAFSLCDPVYSSITNASIVEMIKMPGRNNTTTERPRGASLLSNVTHSNEQYGMIMVYFAVKGMVPPSHEPR